MSSPFSIIGDSKDIGHSFCLIDVRQVLDYLKMTNAG